MTTRARPPTFPAASSEGAAGQEKTPRKAGRIRLLEQRLIDGCVAPHIKLFVRLALTTGARKGATLSLTWPAVDFERGLIRLGHVQGGKGRATVPFTAASRAWLKAAETQWVIEYAGERVKNVRRGFGEACRRAKLTDVTPHVLRHTAAVWMAEAGVPMSEIAQMLGHSRTEVTESVYARYSPDHLRKAAAALDI